MVKRDRKERKKGQKEKNEEYGKKENQRQKKRGKRKMKVGKSYNSLFFCDVNIRLFWTIPHCVNFEENALLNFSEMF